ncbi:MAG: hypothetical protein ACKVS6_05945 [Planctomycetota bacterium]
MIGSRRILQIVLLLIFPAASPVLLSCSASGDDPPRSHFRPHSMFRIEPIPNANETPGAGPHDDLGLRGATKSGDASYKILVLGGAFIYGFGKPVAEAPPQLLDLKLASMNRNAIVANGGCPGQGLVASMLRFHFLLSSWKPTHVLYYPGLEDVSIYCSTIFTSDLNHMPRPWTGAAMPPVGALSSAGADAYARDLTSLEVMTRMNGASLILASPSGDRLAPFRASLWKVANQRKIVCVDLPTDLDGALTAIAQAIVN